MSPKGALLAALLLAAMPPWIHPSASVVLPSIAAGILLLFGLRQPSLAAAAGGAFAAAVAYALALRSAAAPADVIVALAFGAAQLLVLQHADFARTFRGTDVPPAIAGSAVQRWAATVALAAAAIALLGGGVALVADGAPPTLRPVLAGAGALLALGGAIAVFGRARRP